MNIQEFIANLEKLLSGLPECDIRSSVEYYQEALQDRVEDGMTEEEAVIAIGTPASAAEKIIQEISVTKLVKARLPKQIPVALIVLGSPVWVPLLIAFAAVVVSFYAAFWAVLWSLTAVYFALLLAFLAAIPFALFCAVQSFLSKIPSLGVGYLGAALFFCGIVAPLLKGAKPVYRSALRATAKSLYLFKRILFFRKAA